MLLRHCSSTLDDFGPVVYCSIRGGLTCDREVDGVRIRELMREVGAVKSSVNGDVVVRSILKMRSAKTLIEMIVGE